MRKFIFLFLLSGLAFGAVTTSTWFAYLCAYVPACYRMGRVVLKNWRVLNG